MRLYWKYAYIVLLICGTLAAPAQDGKDTSLNRRYAHAKVQGGFHTGLRVGPAARFISSNTFNYVYSSSSLSQSFGLDLYFPVSFQHGDLDVLSSFRYASLNTVTHVEIPARASGFDQSIEIRDRESVPLFEFRMLGIYAPQSNLKNGPEFGLGVAMQYPALLSERTVRQELVVDGSKQEVDVLLWEDAFQDGANRGAEIVWSLGYRYALGHGRMLALRVERNLSGRSELRRIFSLPILGTDIGGRQELSKRYWMLTLNALLF
ncbi:MAG: hypothetical protein H6606_01060 [Flavobacteriales bacterium]|nr:hypothetical protein [Flavobacteriales bacterium]